jgi:transcription elongation factor Elf1
MKSVLTKSEARLFPCCVCGKPREVRTSKKGKPYLHCDPCGLQMFVRIDAGIRLFEQLIKDAERNNIWQRLYELQRRYEFECPKCGKKFWLTTELIKTSWMNGKLEGYRCPEADCGGIAVPEKAA